MKRKAFTLTEVLIVIAIIVLLVAFAIPAFSLITGGRSVEGATNQLSATLGRARAEAIGLQKPTGVLFFSRGDRVYGAIVTHSEISVQVGLPTAIGDPVPEVWFDLADAEFLPMPKGISLQTICNSESSGAGRISDGYLGYNFAGIHSLTGAANQTTVPFGGVILFDGAGRIISKRYGFKFLNHAGEETRMAQLLKPTTLADFIPGDRNHIVTSQLGTVLFERDLFATQNGTDGDAHVTGGPYGAATVNGTEAFEEAWLDANSTPLLINRYTGTLVKGE